MSGIYPEGNRSNILVALDEVKSKGNVVTFHIARTILDGFTQDTEWRQTEIWKNTKKIRLAIIFPTDRPCKRAVLLERSKHKSTVLGAEHFTQDSGGRQMLVWEKTRPKRAEVYTLEFDW